MYACCVHNSKRLHFRIRNWREQWSNLNLSSTRIKEIGFEASYQHKCLWPSVSLSWTIPSAETSGLSLPSTIQVLFFQTQPCLKSTCHKTEQVLVTVGLRDQYLDLCQHLVHVSCHTLGIIAGWDPGLPLRCFGFFFFC